MSRLNPKAHSNHPALLQVRDLGVSFRNGQGQTSAVQNVSFDIKAGEILGIVGESGSGKSVTCRAILGLLPSTATISGSIQLEGQEVIGMGEDSLRQLRGEAASMIFQNPASHLDPLMTIGRQVSEPLEQHKGVNRKDARLAAIQGLSDVKLSHPEQSVNSYPHQLSGGMKQRAMIAAAMACQPRLLLADEPTTALDVTVQAHILELLKELNSNHGLSIVLVSHDLAVIASICDRVMVMRSGEIIEQGSCSQIISAPIQPYTRELIASQPEKLTSLNAPALETTPKTSDQPGTADLAPVLLEVNNLGVEFKLPHSGILPLRRNRPVLKAVDRISLDLKQGESLGIVGESGSGKSTVARVIMGLVKPISGDIKYRGESILTVGRRQTRQEPDNTHRGIQMAFQNPFDSLNPRMTVAETISEPLRLHKIVRKPEIAARVEHLMQLVELQADLADRKPGQLSGGQCQRVGIARALAMNPEILIADEVTSALDVTIQAQIMALLNRLRSEVGLTVIFISHDLSLVKVFCDRVAVFKAGKIVESGPVEEVLSQPREEYTRKLIASAPEINPC
jgi:peptide/nickel transport system ATP-binding protein